MITEPRWKSYIVETTTPIFTPEQCQIIINAGRSEPRQNAGVGNNKGDGGSGIDTETRRTLAANCDVQFDPIQNRGIA